MSEKVGPLSLGQDDPNAIFSSGPKISGGTAEMIDEEVIAAAERGARPGRAHPDRTPRPARPAWPRCCWSIETIDGDGPRGLRDGHQADPRPGDARSRGGEGASAPAAAAEDAAPRARQRDRRRRAADRHAARPRPCPRSTDAVGRGSLVFVAGGGPEHQVPAIAPAIQEPVEVPLGPLRALGGRRSRTTSDARARSTGHRHHHGAEPGILHPERVLDVGGPVPAELLVEQPDRR